MGKIKPAMKSNHFAFARTICYKQENQSNTYCSFALNIFEIVISDPQGKSHLWELGIYNSGT